MTSLHFFELFGYRMDKWVFTRYSSILTVYFKTKRFELYFYINNMRLKLNISFVLKVINFLSFHCLIHQMKMKIKHSADGGIWWLYIFVPSKNFYFLLVLFFLFVTRNSHNSQSKMRWIFEKYADYLIFKVQITNHT